MKILFACHRFPFPPNRGGKIRPFNIIRHLSQKHEIVVASLTHTRQELDEGGGLKDYCAEIHAEVLPEKVRWLQAVRAFPTAMPSSVAYFASSRLRARVKQAAQRFTFDAVIVHCAFAAQYGLEAQARFRLMDFGDLDSGKWLDYSKCRSFPLSWGYCIEGHKLRRYERQVASAFDYCTLTTPGELEEFRKLEIQRPHHVIPNGVDGTYFRSSGEPCAARPVVAFLGRMDYYPNIDGVLHFAKEVLPILRAAIPDVEFRIIGSNPAPEIEQLRQNPGVTVTGHVPDVREYLTDAAVSVAPLRLARGTQNKILESMAMGIPVVATAEAAKGVAAVPEEHILVANGTEAFAAQVMRILKDRQLRADLSKAGRQRVEGYYSWTSMELFDSILNSAGRQSADGVPQSVGDGLVEQLCEARKE